MDQNSGKQEVVIVGRPEVTLVGRPEVTLSSRQGVVITDVHIPFGSLVTLLVKVAVAAIPALIILGALGFFVAGIFVAMLHGPKM